jgi:hypothetical protein
VEVGVAALLRAAVLRGSRLGPPAACPERGPKSTYL